MSLGIAVANKPKRDDVAVKIARAVYRRARQIATHRGIPLAEYLSGLLDKPVQRDYDRMVRDMNDEGGSNLNGSHP